MNFEAQSILLVKGVGFGACGARGCAPHCPPTVLWGGSPPQGSRGRAREASADD